MLLVETRNERNAAAASARRAVRFLSDARAMRRHGIRAKARMAETSRGAEKLDDVRQQQWEAAET